MSTCFAIGVFVSCFIYVLGFVRGFAHGLRFLGVGKRGGDFGVCEMCKL